MKSIRSNFSHVQDLIKGLGVITQYLFTSDSRQVLETVTLYVINTNCKVKTVKPYLSCCREPQPIVR